MDFRCVLLSRESVRGRMPYRPLTAGIRRAAHYRCVAAYWRHAGLLFEQVRVKRKGKAMTSVPDASSTGSGDVSRRRFLKQGCQVAAGVALAGSAIPAVHAGEDNTIRLALIGAGGRGSGAVADAMSARGGPVKLHAMADIDERKLSSSHEALVQHFGDKIDVSPDRRFVGFDAYRKAIDCLRPGDIAMLTAYAYCRPTHMEYAVDKGVNVFMEKSFAPDPGGLHRMLRGGREGGKKNLKIAAGLMCRHSVARQELIKRIRDGATWGHHAHPGVPHVGRLGTRQAAARTQRTHVPNHSRIFLGQFRFHDRDADPPDRRVLLVERFVAGLRPRASADESPDSADRSQNLDTYAMEYTFADGTKALVNSRSMNDTYNDFATYVHGTKCAAQFSGNIHAATVHTYKGQVIAQTTSAGRPMQKPCTPWQAEWKVLLEKIRSDQPHNETKRAVYSNFASLMGRAAAHINNIVTWDDVFRSDFRFCDYVDDLNYESPAPIPPDSEGRYPLPIPGRWKEF